MAHPLLNPATRAAVFVIVLLGLGCNATALGGPQTPPAAAPPIAPPSTPSPPVRPSTTPPATPTPSPSATNPKFGVNLERLVSWSRSRVYIDAVRTAYGFDTIAHPRDGKAALGPDGWPTGDFGVLLIEAAAPSMGGTYKIVFPGTVQEIRTAAGAKVTGQAYDSVSGVTRADLSFAPKSNPNLNVQFIGASLKGRLKVLRPGYTEADERNKIFTDEFLAMLKAVSPGVIRGMDFLEINGNAVVKWQDRPTRDTPIYSETYGDARGRRFGAAPVEDLVEICNRVGSDLWLNVPVSADDDYRERLAELIATKLRRDLHVYIEFGNENWNRSFRQHDWNLAAARSSRSANGYDAQDEIAGWQRTANETVKLAKVFRAAFDRISAGQSARVRPVLCGQGTTLDTLKLGLQYLAGHAGPSTGSGQGKPADLLYGVAVAAYAPLTPDLPLNDWRVRLLGGTHVTAFVKLADSYGLASCCYESGVDPSGAKTSPAAQKDPRMQAVMAAYWAAWKGTGPVLHYNLCNSPSGGTVWGLTDDAADLTQPKFKAAMPH